MFYRIVVGLSIIGLVELLSCVEVLKNVMGDIRGSAGPVFSLGRLRNIVNVLLEIVEVNWHLIALILLEIVMVTCCDVDGC